MAGTSIQPTGCILRSHAPPQLHAAWICCQRFLGSSSAHAKPTPSAQVTATAASIKAHPQMPQQQPLWHFFRISQTLAAKAVNVTDVKSQAAKRVKSRSHNPAAVQHAPLCISKTRFPVHQQEMSSIWQQAACQSGQPHLDASSAPSMMTWPPLRSSSLYICAK